MDLRDVDENKSKLIELKERVLSRIYLLDNEKKRSQTPLTISLDDQAIEVENDEVIDRLDELELIKLQNINNALKRIKDGIFGVCRTCAGEIEAKRLMAIPYVLLCIDCQSDRLH